MFNNLSSKLNIVNETILIRRLFTLQAKLNPNKVQLVNHSTESSVDLKVTQLNKFHVNNGGKMVPFAGYSMPVLYSDLTTKDSHLHTRSKASLFDVSHMLQTRIHGKDRFQFANDLTVTDVFSLAPNQGSLSLFTNCSGGIIDDLIVTNTSSSYVYIVSNAGCMEKDKSLMRNHCDRLRGQGKDVTIEFINDQYSLIALQGPEAANCLQSHVDCDLNSLYFMYSTIGSIAGVADCRITRCGYTGEDGFELSIPNDSVQLVVESLIDSSDGTIKLAGLGARDTLRLEAGLCLYGNDIDEETTPVEAGLVWTISKSRRERKDFPGAEIIMKQLKDKPTKRRVGLKSVTKGPAARQGASIIEAETGQEIGKVTSGCPSPSLNANLSMGYIKTGKGKIGSTVKCLIRNKHYEFEVTKMPFVPSQYYIKQ
ncbi:aminomethyltransferase, mitochondrial-like [Panonychus citri]|uniref:aminomethyltransferase, mitochondrial-like n=1 Tax=Panonychus citri TaxID=50023 RepID=UPI002307948A|nr:aminomethyltransferase, mitochondrial-like [Panonychus citri]